MARHGDINASKYGRCKQSCCTSANEVKDMGMVGVEPKLSSLNLEQGSFLHGIGDVVVVNGILVAIVEGKLEKAVIGGWH